MCITRISLGLIMTSGMRSTLSSRLIFGGLVITLGGLVITLGGLVITNVAYAEAGNQFSVRTWDYLMNAQCPHKWWSTLKSAVFGSIFYSPLPLFDQNFRVFWSVNRLGRQKCSQAILMKRHQGIL